MNAAGTWLPKSVVCLRYYNVYRFRSDVIAAFLLLLDTFPLSVSIAMVCGIDASKGLACAAAAGFLASALGESKIRISAPNVVFIVAVSNIVARGDVYGLSSAILSAAMWLIFLGTTGLGAAVRSIPRPITVGFATGISLLMIPTLLLALIGSSASVSYEQEPAGVISGMGAPAVVLTCSMLIILVICKKISARIPAVLVAMLFGSVLTAVLHLPVQMADARHTPLFFLATTSISAARGPFFYALAQGLPIALLAAIESLKAQDVASRASGEQLNPRRELLLDGGTNVVCAFLGGPPVAGSASITTANARNGAQTPVAGALSAGLLLAILLFPVTPLFTHMPVAAISLVILVNVLGMNHWVEMPTLIKASRMSALACLATTLLIVFTDLLTATAAGLFIGMCLYARD